MARYDLGEGAIFMLHEAGPGPGGFWHVPAPGAGGQTPGKAGYATACGQYLLPASVEILRLPFTISLDMPDPEHICRDCRF